MAKAYLIGGTPRCGKTSIALCTLAKRPMFSTSSDSIRLIQKSILTETEEPDLFLASSKFTEQAIIDICSTCNASEIIDWQNRESAVVWRSVKKCIEGYIAEDLDVLVEGVAILPEYLSQLECDYSTVFIGNTASNHGQNMVRFARSGEYDWMSDFSDTAILHFAAFTNAYSEFIRAEANKHSYEYFEMSVGNYNETIQQVSNALLNKN